MKSTKSILTIFILFISIISAHAKCMNKGLSVFPSGRVLRPNSIIVIDGYANSQHTVNGLDTKYPVYLKSNKKKIRLKVKEILVGQFKQTQAILVPESNLTSGLEYTLVIENLPTDESLDTWNSELKKDEPLVYKVVEEKDTTKPAFESIPNEIKKSITYLGCGPAVFVDFDCKVIENSEYLIKATVKNLELDKETSYYIEPHNGTLKIGHGMCSGAFDFGEGSNFEIEFSILDASGNFTKWTGERIKFTKPTESNSSGKPW